MHHFFVFRSTSPYINSCATALDTEFQIDDVTLLLTINIKESLEQEMLEAAMTPAIAGQR